MKILIFLAGLGLAVAGSTPSEAAAAKKTARHSKPKAASSKKGATAKSAHRGQLQTDVSFDDSVLHGEYQTPEEALAKVENEKGLGDLIGVRKHYKDRLPVAAEQE